MKKNYQFLDHLWNRRQNQKAFADRDDKFYYNRLKYYKDRVLVPLAYINFDEYIKELNEERDILNKDLNKALKDIEKRPENKKAHNKRDNLQQQLDANEQKIEEGNVTRRTW
ncbi:peptidoglycan bridge formation glycyltransferase FemA/FemB family protein [Staphylococcus aureus]